MAFRFFRHVRLFHNLRASRETELMREYDLATVCKWIGNSPAVAAKHYATSMDLNADFRRAAGLDEAQQKAQHQAQQKAQQSPTGDDDQPMTPSTKSGKFPGEKTEIVDDRQPTANTDKSNQWAIQDSNL